MQNVYFVLYISYLQFFLHISLAYKQKFLLLCHTYLIGAFPLQIGIKNLSNEVNNVLQSK